MANLKQEIAAILANLQIQKPDALMADDPLTADNINRMVASIDELTKAISAMNTITPALPLIGYKYFRFPGDPLPWDLHTATDISEWTLLDERYPGVALRLSGGNASKFKEDSAIVSYDEKTKGDGGAQMDALQDHTHVYDKNRYTTARGDVHGLADDYYYRTHTEGVFNARKDTETRMKNITVEVYVYKESEYPQG